MRLFWIRQLNYGQKSVQSIFLNLFVLLSSALVGIDNGYFNFQAGSKKRGTCSMITTLRSLVRSTYESIRLALTEMIQRRKSRDIIGLKGSMKSGYNYKETRRKR